MDILGLLSKKGAVSPELLAKIRADGVSPDKIEQALPSYGVKTSDILAAKAEYLNIPPIILENENIPFDVLKFIPEESALHYEIIPLAVKNGALEIGVVDPENLDARDAINFIASKNNIPYKLFLISKEDYDRGIISYRSLSGEVTKALHELSNDDIINDADEPDIKPENINKKINEVNIIEDAPVKKIVATILRYAIEGEASDVHIEPMVEKVRVRFRLDGVLHTSLILPIKVLNAVVARIKIISDMKLDEKRKPQDGRFSAHIDKRKIDFRVSTFPTYYGEKVVMRILDQSRGVKSVDELGFSPRDLALIKEAIHRPYGLILISGPTGSGKTTTLYSMLGEVDRETNNVLSLEDPVEYNIEGISQSQIRPEIDYTFANGLRTTLRQDPDIIMVGEIRDKETAALAVQAALTGHLVFSTIHTNDAIGVIPRLVDMGVDPYLIAPVLALSMAQRLVAKVAPGGGKEVPIEGSIKMMMDKQFSDLPEEFKKTIPNTGTVLMTSPTPEFPKGTHGRQAVFEVFKMTKELERIILTNPVEPEIWKIVRKDGMMTMKEDAIVKALKHIVPFEEVNTLA